MPSTWLLRIPEVFLPWEAEILSGLRVKTLRKLGKDYRLVKVENPELFENVKLAKWVSWKLPVHHSWPCSPPDIDGFIEKAAQAIAKKFGSEPIQALMTSALDPSSSNRYYRSLASNLRGRVLQLFSDDVAQLSDAETQDPERSSLFCFVGKEGLFAGIQSPAACGGFHAGGTKFIRQNEPEAISRAGAKLAEALHHLKLRRPCPQSGAHWLELGASPGGMTAELLARDYQVTAIDRAPLDVRLKNRPLLRAVIGDAASYQAPSEVVYDAILSDMNGDALGALSHVIRLAKRLRSDGLVIFTLKLPMVSSYQEVNELAAQVLAAAALAGLRLMDCKHLTYNRMEFTCFFCSQSKKDGVPSACKW